MNNIMFQGTSSSVGKSVITAGICRVLRDLNYSVAPFKSQNMALNSFITKDGKEMGRAQVVQAEAARIEPMVEMNPILLKPSSDVGSQVIVMGEICKNMTAVEYHQSKPKFRRIIMDAYNKLQSKYDTIVMEGAGSPAEINLREGDLVNMGMAEMADAPVVLIGDIDRGGVFASLYGTYMLLKEKERARVKGFIVNKFRGDVDLLMPGIKMLEEKINIPCLGVVPFFRLHIDDEDSVCLEYYKSIEKEIKIGVVWLPHISNFSDFTPFEIHEDVELKYIKSTSEFNDIDLLIIPGSKNTIEDMNYLVQTGLAKKILEYHSENFPIIGICGGYQILGREIIDSGHNESSKGKIEGLGLVNSVTRISDEKRTVQVKGDVDIEFMGQKHESKVSGYEIHMGVTDFQQPYPAFARLDDQKCDGVVNDNVLGTYLHGVFENDSFRNFVLEIIRKRKGLTKQDSNAKFNEFKETQYNQLAKIIRENIDIDRIIEIIENGR